LAAKELRRRQTTEGTTSQEKIDATLGWAAELTDEQLEDFFTMSIGQRNELFTNPEIAWMFIRNELATRRRVTGESESSPATGYTRSRRWAVDRRFIQGQAPDLLSRIRDDKAYRAERYTNPDEAHCLATAELARRQGENFDAAYRKAEAALAAQPDTTGEPAATDSNPPAVQDPEIAKRLRLAAEVAKELDYFELLIHLDERNPHLLEEYGDYEAAWGIFDTEAGRREAASSRQELDEPAHVRSRAMSFLSTREQAISKAWSALNKLATHYKEDELLTVEQERLVAFYEARERLADHLRSVLLWLDDAQASLLYLIEHGEVPAELQTETDSHAEAAS
jgi:hypothetical protein